MQSRYRQAVVFSLALAFLFSYPADTRPLDPEHGRHPILAQITDVLDAVGIDIVSGNTRDIPISTRPRIANLSGFPIDSDLESIGDWMIGFKRGALGSMMIVAPSAGSTPHGGSASPDVEAFARAWDAASSGRRIFIAFARADAERAEAVRLELAKRGYVVFTYIHSPSSQATFEADFVGRVFSTAGHHLIIDSAAARKSAGVLFEAVAYADLSRPSGSAGKLQNLDINALKRRLCEP